MNRFRSGALVLLSLLCCLVAPRAANAETFNTCTGFITSIPAVISTQGTWCFKQDLATAITSGKAITINTNNVTIDCNDFKLGGLAAGIGTQADGIFASGRLNATVRHCNIRGFQHGLYFSGSLGGGHSVEDSRFDNNTYVGIQVEGDGSVIRRDRVFDTGGTTSAASAFGIVTSDSADVLDNTVSGVAATAGGNGNVFGIIVQFSNSGQVAGNRVRGLAKDGTGITTGIYVNSSDRITIRGNDLVGDGSAPSIGLDCFSNLDRSKDNYISAFATGISTCGDDGGNVIVP